MMHHGHQRLHERLVKFKWSERERKSAHVGVDKRHRIPMAGSKGRSSSHSVGSGPRSRASLISRRTWVSLASMPIPSSH